MRKAEELYFGDRKDWRTWLTENHETKKEVWLVYYKKDSGKPSIPYDCSVEEALCFGWVDSIIRRIDDEKFARKFTPRKAVSKWSEANKKRVEEMIRAGKMMPAGLAKVEEAKKSGRWFKTLVTKRELAVPSYFEEALAGNKKALDCFNRLAPSYKRNAVLWVESAKREETRMRRLAEFIGLLEHNKKLGMK
jgi:uncharacterized protein YdeI (YjbR/CyaY-like superfamily)